MREQGFNVGGEQSGHIILSDYTTTGDGFVAALQILDVIKRQQKPASEVCHRFEPLPQILRNVRYKNGKPLENPNVSKVIAGATSRLNGSGRVLVRPSGTEPVIRVMAEGDDPILIEQIVDEIAGAVSASA
jgi:phosphoglucosamine mutase